MDSLPEVEQYIEVVGKTIRPRYSLNEFEDGTQLVISFGDKERRDWGALSGLVYTSITPNAGCKQVILNRPWSIAGDTVIREGTTVNVIGIRPDLQRPHILTGQVGVNGYLDLTYIDASLRRKQVEESASINVGRKQTTLNQYIQDTSSLRKEDYEEDITPQRERELAIEELEPVLGLVTITTPLVSEIQFPLPSNQAA